MIYSCNICYINVRLKVNKVYINIYGHVSKGVPKYHIFDEVKISNFERDNAWGLKISGVKGNEEIFWKMGFFVPNNHCGASYEQNMSFSHIV